MRGAGRAPGVTKAVSEPTCAHWISAGIAGSNYPTGRALTSYGFGCPYCEIERLRAALERIANGKVSEINTPFGPLHAAGIAMQWEIDAKIAREALGEPKP